MKPRSNPFLRSAALAASIVLCFGASVQAANFYWDGGTADIGTNGDGISAGGAGDWNTTLTNWDQGNALAHTAWLTNDAIFGGTTAGTVALTSDVTVNNMLFTTTGYILSGAQTITLNGTTPTITTATGVTTTIESVLDGTAGLTKAGAGTLILSGLNIYTGGTFLNAGILQANNASALSTGNITFSGGTLQYTAASAGQDYGTRIKNSTASAIRLDANGQALTLTGVDSSNTGGLNLSNSAAGNVTVSLTAANALTGGITVGDKVRVNLSNASGAGANAVTVNSGGQVFVNGAGTVANNFTLNGSGWLGDATPLGALRLSNGSVISGSVTRNSAATITADSGSATISGLVSGAGILTKTGAGTLTLNGSGVNNYTGGLTINEGTLTLGSTAASTFATGSTTVTMTKGASAVTLNLGALNTEAGSVINFLPNTAWTTAVSANEIVKFTTSVTRNGVAITLPAASSTGYIGANLFCGTGGNTRYVQARNTAGVYQLVQAPTATPWVDTGANASNVYNAGTAASPLSASQSMYAIIFNHTSAVTKTLGNVSTGFTLTTNGVLNINSATLTFAPGTTPGKIQIGAEKDLVLNAAGSGGITISAAISDSSAGASGVTINSTSTGVTTLSGANTYSGITTLNRGTLAISLGASETNGAASSVLGAIPVSATPGKLVFNGGTLSITPSGAWSMATNRGIQVNAGGGTITNTAGQTLTMSSIIAGTGAMTFNITSSSGGITLGSGNTFSGGATLSGAGTFFANNAANYGTGTLTLNGAQMRSSTTAFSSLPNAVNIAATTKFVSVGGEQTLTFSGPAVLTGGSRTLTADVGSSVAGKSVTFSGGISEDIAGRGLTKSGTGTLTLSGASTYTGTTTVSAGRLALTKNTALYSNNPVSWTAANITVASGATLALNTGTSGTDFTSDNIDTIAALGTASTGFVGGSFLGLDTTSGNFTYASNLENTNAGANARGLIKLGSNSLTVSGTNSYTGITMIGGGTLVAGSTSAFGAEGNDVYFMTTPAAGTSGNQLAGGNLELATDSSVNAYDLNGTSSFSSTLTLSRANNGDGFTQNLGVWTAGNSTLIVAKGANWSMVGTPTVAFTAGMNVGGGSAGSSTLTPTDTNISITGPVNIGINNAAKTLVLDGNIAGNSISGNITNNLNTLSLAKSGTSTWTLSGNNSYTGTTAVNAGTLKAGSTTGLSSASAFTTADVATAILDLDGNSNTIGSLAGGGAAGGNVALGSATLTTGGNNTSTSYAGNISGTSGNLIKTGSGVFTLASANGYTGTTAVNGGTLIVNNTLASSGTTVANLATLGGTGSIANLVTVNSGGTLSAATATTAGTLTLGSLTLDSGSNLAYEFGATSDLVDVTGANALTINGGILSLYATGGVAPLTTNGTYTLFSYVTGFGGSLTNLSVLNSQAGKTYAVNDAGGTITLTLGTAVTTEWNGSASPDITWTNASNWSGSTPNSLGAVANFGITPTAPTTVSVDGAKTVGSIIFNNSNAYTVSGGAPDTITLDNGIAAGAIGVTAGSHAINAPILLNGPANIVPDAGTTLTLGGQISGAKALSFSGAGTTIIEGANSYTGATTISAGTLQIGNGGTTGSLATASAITNNATLAFKRSDTLTQGTDFANGITGSGSVNQIGLGTTILNGPNTYSGATTVTTGVLNIQNNTALGTTAGATSVTSGAALQVQGGLSAVAENLTLNGTGVSNDGALRSISGANTLSGTVALGSTGVRINSDTAATALTLSNIAGITGTGFNLTAGGAGDTVISGGVKTGTSATLTKDGDGTLTLAGASTYTGATTITKGRVLLQGGVGYATSGFAIASNAVLELNTATTTGYATTTFSGAGTLRKSGTGNASWASPIVTFALDSGSLIDVQEGSFTGGAYGNDVWSILNKSDLKVASGAVFETVEANVRVDALSGSGVIATGYSGSGYTAMTIGVDGGSNTFTGTLASGHSTGNITKIGVGVQTFTGAGGTYNGNLTLSDGVFSIDTIANGGLSTTLTTTANSNTATVGSATGLQVGMAVWANNNIQRAIVPFGTTITEISGNTITLSNSAVVTGAAITGAAIGFGNGLGIGTNAAARLVFNGGTLQYTGGTASTDRNFTINADKTATIDISNAATNLTISGASTATNGALTKTGDGALSLSGANLYSGATTIATGTLALDGAGSINNSAVIDVQGGATLSIAGVTTSTTIGGTQTLKGTGIVDLGTKTMTMGANSTLAPGASPGTLNFATTGGKLEFVSGSIIDFDLGTSSDLIKFSSAGDWLAGSNAAILKLKPGAGFNYDTSYTIFQNVTTPEFTFASIEGYNSGAYLANFAQDGSDYKISFTVVPEPRAALLGGLGLLALLRRRRGER